VFFGREDFKITSAIVQRVAVFVVYYFAGWTIHDEPVHTDISGLTVYAGFCNCINFAGRPYGPPMIPAN